MIQNKTECEKHPPSQQHWKLKAKIPEVYNACYTNKDDYFKDAFTVTLTLKAKRLGAILDYGQLLHEV